MFGSFSSWLNNLLLSPFFLWHTQMFQYFFNIFISIFGEHSQILRCFIGENLIAILIFKIESDQ